MELLRKMFSIAERASVCYEYTVRSSLPSSPTPSLIQSISPPTTASSPSSLRTSKHSHSSNIPALRVQRPATLVNRAATSVGLKLDHASSVDTDGNPDEVGVSHSGSLVDDIARPVLHRTRVRVAAKSSVAVKSEAVVPAITADLERADVAGGKTWVVAAGGFVGVDGFSVVVDDFEVVVMAVLTSAVWRADGAVGTGRPDDAQVLGLGEHERSREGEGDASEGRHVVGLRRGSLWGLESTMRLSLGC